MSDFVYVVESSAPGSRRTLTTERRKLGLADPTYSLAIRINNPDSAGVYQPDIVLSPEKCRKLAVLLTNFADLHEMVTVETVTRTTKRRCDVKPGEKVVS